MSLSVCITSFIVLASFMFSATSGSPRFQEVVSAHFRPPPPPTCGSGDVSATTLTLHHLMHTLFHLCAFEVLMWLALRFRYGIEGSGLLPRLFQDSLLSPPSSPSLVRRGGVLVGWPAG